MLIGNGPFTNIIRKGIEDSYFVYTRGDLVCGPGDPSAAIVIDDDSWIYTMSQAEVDSLWPRVIIKDDGGGDQDR